MFILLISNHTVFLVQFGTNLHLWVFQKAETALAEAARAISALWMTHSGKLIPNWTRNRVITCNNCSSSSVLILVNTFEFLQPLFLQALLLCLWRVSIFLHFALPSIPCNFPVLLQVHYKFLRVLLSPSSSWTDQIGKAIPKGKIVNSPQLSTPSFPSTRSHYALEIPGGRLEISNRSSVSKFSLLGSPHASTSIFILRVWCCYTQLLGALLHNF